MQQSAITKGSLIRYVAYSGQEYHYVEAVVLDVNDDLTFNVVIITNGFEATITLGDIKWVRVGEIWVTDENEPVLGLISEVSAITNKDEFNHEVTTVRDYAISRRNGMEMLQMTCAVLLTACGIELPAILATRCSELTD